MFVALGILTVQRVSSGGSTQLIVLGADQHFSSCELHNLPHCQLLRCRRSEHSELHRHAPHTVLEVPAPGVEPATDLRIGKFLMKLTPTIRSSSACPSTASPGHMSTSSLQSSADESSLSHRPPCSQAEQKEPKGNVVNQVASLRCNSHAVSL